MIEMSSEVFSAEIVVAYAVLICSAFAAYWIFNSSPVADWFKQGEGVVAPFFAFSAILFALFATALSSNLIRQHEEAAQSQVREAASLRNIVMYASLAGVEGVDLLDSTSRYIRAVVQKEWPAMVRKDHSEKEAAIPRLRELGSQVHMLAKNKHIAPHLPAALLRNLEILRETRQQRISLAYSEIPTRNWARTVALGVLLIVSVGVCHLRKPRAMKITIALTLIGVLAAIHELYQMSSPYVGPVAISNGPLVETLNSLSDLLETSGS